MNRSQDSWMSFQYLHCRAAGNEDGQGRSHSDGWILTLYEGWLVSLIASELRKANSSHCFGAEVPRIRPVGICENEMGLAILSSR